MVGDGSLTGGMAWEALNNIAGSDRPMVILVNDNERSYSPTIGGLAHHLATLRTTQGYERFLQWGRRTLQRTPVVGAPVYEALHGMKKGLKDIAPFEISVAAYPETHPDALSPQDDIDNLKRKLDAGATRAISQFFFSPEAFFRFRDACAATGIDAPILPGILPVTNVAQARKFASACGAEFPAWMDGLFQGLDEKPAARQLVAATVAAEMCRRLYAGGVRDFHFYTLNRPELAYAICHMLGKRPVGEAA